MITKKTVEDDNLAKFFKTVLDNLIKNKSVPINISGNTDCTLEKVEFHISVEVMYDLK